jgi:hypothetical protein
VGLAAAASPRPKAAVPDAKTRELLPLDASLARGEEVVPPSPAAQTATSDSNTPTSAPVEKLSRLAEQERPAVARVPPPPRIAAADPRQSCAGLSYIFAARCEAANCDRAAYSRHPRCDAVRAERRRDEARRNPTLGY